MVALLNRNSIVFCMKFDGTDYQAKTCLNEGLRNFFSMKIERILGTGGGNLFSLEVGPSTPTTRWET